MATVTPHLHIECKDADDFKAAQAYLERSGYEVGDIPRVGKRTDDAQTLVITVDLPAWEM